MVGQRLQSACRVLEKDRFFEPEVAGISADLTSAKKVFVPDNTKIRQGPMVTACRCTFPSCRWT